MDGSGFVKCGKKPGLSDDSVLPFTPASLAVPLDDMVQVKVRAEHSRRLSLQVAANERMKAQAFGTSWAIAISYVQRMSTTIFGSGKRSPSSKASR